MNMNNHLTKDVILLRLNDLNNKIKNLDRKMSYMVEKMEYNNIIINEIKDEIVNASPILNRSISPICSPRHTTNKMDSMVGRNAEQTYLGGVPTFKSLRNSPTYLPDINTKTNTNTNINSKNRNRSKSNIISRRSFDSLSSYNY